MMQHVWDHFDYTQDTTWLRAQGYPLLKGTARFWLSQLQEDTFTHDATLVVNPCNSPETGPTTFGCAHYQHLIYQVLTAILSSASAAGDHDADFLAAARAALTRLDTGVHIAAYGGLKEWKIPDAYGFDGPSTHRHLSHLVGWFPGYSVSAYAGGYAANASIQDAVRATLVARGLGDASDANAGWEKVWRAACWARLNDTAKAYEELRFAVDVNFAPNGLSMYTGLDPPFQIDANFGFAGAVLSMLVVDLPVPYGVKEGKERVVVLGPAIPEAWGGGSVVGLRIRGGVVVDFGWDGNGIVRNAVPRVGGKGKGGIVFVNVRGDVLARI